MTTQFAKIGFYHINLANVAYVREVEAGMEVHFVGVAEHVLCDDDDSKEALLQATGTAENSYGGVRSVG